MLRLDLAPRELRLHKNIVDPMGFSASAYDAPARSTVNRRSRKQRTGSTATDEEDDDAARVHLKLKKAWDIALAPAKTIPMNAFMLWMSGSGIQIFSILITGMLLMQPVRALVALPKAFVGYETKRGSLLMPKLAFVCAQILVLAMGLYKLQSMGLLPTAASDWLAFLPPKQALETSYVVW